MILSHLLRLTPSRFHSPLLTSHRRFQPIYPAENVREFGADHGGSKRIGACQSLKRDSRGFRGCAGFRVPIHFPCRKLGSAQTTAILVAAIMGSNQSKQSNRRTRSSLNFQWSSEEAKLIDLLFCNLVHVDVLHKSNSGFCQHLEMHR